MELSEKEYKKIVKLCKEGDRLTERNKFEKALLKYYEALKHIPEPKTDWKASTWVYVAIGDVLFLLGKYEESLNTFMDALKCPDGIGNAFINLRIGQCFYELENFDKAKSYLLQSYMVEGEEIFEEEEKKYFLEIIDLIDEECEEEEIISSDKKEFIIEENLLEKIDCLFIDASEESENGNYTNAYRILNDIWGLIPENKSNYSESYDVVVFIITICIKNNDLKLMNKWAEKIFECDQQRLDDGDKEFYYGIVCYENKEFDKALKYFKIANKKSYGNSFDDSEFEKKYREFYYTNKDK